MPHLCVGANSWNCGAARLDSTRLAARAKNEERNERHLESGAKVVDGEFGGVAAATNSMRVQTRQDSNNCKLLPLLPHTSFEDFK